MKKGISDEGLKKIAQQMDPSFQVSSDEDYVTDVLQFLEDASATLSGLLQRSERLGYEEGTQMHENISAIIANEFEKPLYTFLSKINDDHGLKDQIQHIYSINTDESYARLFR